MDAIAAILAHPLVLMAVSIACQYVPGLRSIIKNVFIPLLQVVLAFFGNVLGPEAATASTLAIPSAIGLHVAAINFGFAGILSGLGNAVLTAGQAYLMQRMFCWPGRQLPAVPKDSV